MISTANSRSLTEEVVFGVASADPEFNYGVIRDENGRVTIRNAVILQERSKNGRIYTKQARQDALRLYEGLGVYVNHGSHGDYNHKIASLSNPRLDEGGRVRADIAMNMGHLRTPQFVDDAEYNPSACALSHEIPAGGYEAEVLQEDILQINRLLEADCVAIVTDGGCNSSLKESTMPKTSELSQEVMDAIAEAVKGLKPDVKPLTEESIQPLMESAVKQVLESCGCLVQPKAEESDIKAQLDAITSERDELQAKVDELTTKVDTFEADEAKRTRTAEIVEEAQSLEVEVTQEVVESLLDLDKEKVTVILSNLKKPVEEGHTPRGSSGSPVASDYEGGNLLEAFKWSS